MPQIMHHAVALGGVQQTSGVILTTPPVSRQVPRRDPVQRLSATAKAKLEPFGQSTQNAASREKAKVRNSVD
jgi:hypothetical protein